MASNTGNGPPDPNQKALSVWSKPIEDKDASNTQSSISEAVSMIKTDDFKNVANTPCARNGFLTGIATGFGTAGVRFVAGGSITKCTNWAAGFFVLGSMASYEYCQYLRRCEKREMKRHIEVVNEGRKEHAKKLAEGKKQQQKQEEERKAAQRPWYKFW